MATASELDKIRCNPIKEGLGAFIHLFESIRSHLRVALSSDTVQVVFSTAPAADVKTLVLDLIQALQIEPAARTLSSRIAERTLSGDLGLLYSRVDANQLDIAPVIPLVEQVVRNEPNAPTWNDADIWHAVFELVARTNPITPPPAFEKAVFDTPLRSSSASQRGIEQTHEEVDHLSEARLRITISSLSPNANSFGRKGSLESFASQTPSHTNEMRTIPFRAVCN